MRRKSANISNRMPIFHHDDWGSQTSTFISPDMFEEFFLPSYKKIYGYYKEHGVDVVIHHADSYAATLVPFMIEMGIDIWQGCMTSNNIADLIAKYGADGVSVAYVRDGQVVDTYAYGSAVKGVRGMTSNTRVRVASISKVLVGLAAQLAVEDGSFDLDADLGDYLGVDIRTAAPGTP
mgnify:CR=1 FL=1